MLDKDPGVPNTFDCTKRFGNPVIVAPDDERFFGSDGDFTVTHNKYFLYILDRNTTNIVGVVPVEAAIDCLASHPSICMLAV